MNTPTFTNTLEFIKNAVANDTNDENFNALLNTLWTAKNTISAKATMKNISEGQKTDNTRLVIINGLCSVFAIPFDDAAKIYDDEQKALMSSSIPVLPPQTDTTVPKIKKFRAEHTNCN